MVYVKGVIAGIVSLVAAGLLSLVIIFIRYRPTASGTPGWDPISLAKSPILWFMVLLIFCLGFYLEIRKAS